jgi:hypothetical protein
VTKKWLIYVYIPGYGKTNGNEASIKGAMEEMESTAK